MVPLTCPRSLFASFSRIGLEGSCLEVKLILPKLDLIPPHLSDPRLSCSQHNTLGWRPMSLQSQVRLIPAALVIVMANIAQSSSSASENAWKPPSSSQSCSPSSSKSSAPIVTQPSTAASASKSGQVSASGSSSASSSGAASSAPSTASARTASQTLKTSGRASSA